MSSRSLRYLTDSNASSPPPPLIKTSFPSTNDYFDEIIPRAAERWTQNVCSTSYYPIAGREKELEVKQEPQGSSLRTRKKLRSMGGVATEQDAQDALDAVLVKESVDYIDVGAAPSTAHHSASEWEQWCLNCLLGDESSLEHAYNETTLEIKVESPDWDKLFSKFQK
ncbi:hypothetical protein CC80DRAFT_510126 [Byssothecium circinans]|uniref:Uncharacterized protein n=1 Tax=Byssothecium circinans TaxID=147558 RepID=A0A6A5TB36_9PLEO|nr:hypothetical protein CC80DRAFT_510126 [Byssothecium circinans]